MHVPKTSPSGLLNGWEDVGTAGSGVVHGGNSSSGTKLWKLMYNVNTIK